MDRWIVDYILEGNGYCQWLGAMDRESAARR